jgi:uncharacterized integral membrane protein
VIASHALRSSCPTRPGACGGQRHAVASHALRLDLLLPHPVQVYPGTYGPWSVEQEDVNEVLAYRAGLNVMTAGKALPCSLPPVPPSKLAATSTPHPVGAPAALVASSAVAALPAEQADALQPWLNPLAGMAAAGLGTSLWLIHIYVTPIKRTIQVRRCFDGAAAHQGRSR